MQSSRSLKSEPCAVWEITVMPQQPDSWYSSQCPHGHGTERLPDQTKVPESHGLFSKCKAHSEEQEGSEGVGGLGGG